MVKFTTVKVASAPVLGVLKISTTTLKDKTYLSTNCKMHGARTTPDCKLAEYSAKVAS